MGKALPLHWHKITPSGGSVRWEGEGTHLVYAVNSHGKGMWWDDNAWSIIDVPVRLQVRMRPRQGSATTSTAPFVPVL